MKPIASPLNILDFAIVNLEYNFIEPNVKGEDDLRAFFTKYDIDIDFAIHGNDVIQVLIKAEINRGLKRLPGYSIFAEVVCFYEFNKSIEIDKDAQNNIGGFSTIYIALNALRGFVSQLTANGPAGRYVLPSVDLNNLISQKKQKQLKMLKKSNKQLRNQKNKV